MRTSAVLLNTVISWAVYGFILTIFMYLREYLPAMFDGNFVQGPNDVIMEISYSYISTLLLLLTAFLVFGFLRLGFSQLKWFSSDSGFIGRIILLYVMTTASYMLTYAVAYRSLPVDIAIDAPLMGAATMLIFAVIPYFRENTFKG